MTNQFFFLLLELVLQFLSLLFNMSKFVMLRISGEYRIRIFDPLLANML